ncbi:MAG: galactose ABC transporter substrate-binding protein [Moraxella sp.]|nr:galactose ABC transporter substrate-binding protein [Moraxella sp.]
MKQHRFLTLIGLSLLAGCSAPPPTNNTANTSYPTAHVGVTISNTTNPFFKAAYAAYEAESQAQPSLTLSLMSANDDQATQFKQYDEMIAKGAKALVINLADVSQGAAVTEKYCNQVPLVFFNRNPGEKVIAGCQNAYFVDGDATQAGVLQGLKVLELWKENPHWDKNKDGIIQFAMLEGIPGHAGAQARTKWSISTMENYPSLGIPTQKILQDYAMFNKEKATEMVTTWMTLPEFQNVEVLLANNDNMALGASTALKAQGIKLPIFGIDATEDGLNAVKSGDITATVLNDAAAQAKTSLRLAANLASGADPLSGIDYRMEYKVIQVPYQAVE